MRFLFLALALAACAPSAPSQPEPSQPEPPAPAIDQPQRLPEPSVRMLADPPPPFTYWAPEGSTIRNRQGMPGQWVAIVGGVIVENYWGDACRASQYQRYVGQNLDALPPLPDARIACTTCPVTDDLRPDRLNVLHDEATRTIETIACY